MKVLVTGDRHWYNKDRIREILSALTDVECIIEGEARGADTLAREVAEELGIPVKKFPADWDKHGKAAGPIRNIQMLDEKPDLVIAFHDNLALSRGTKHTVTEANKRRIPVRLVTQSDIVWEACPLDRRFP